MKGLKGILSLLWRGWFVLIATVATLTIGVFIILPLSFREKDYARAYYFLRIWAIIIFFFSGLGIKKYGFVDLRSYHPYIIIANHTSMMDIMVMLIVNKSPMVFIGKKELEKLPIFGYIYKNLMITVDRNDPNSRRKVYSQSIIKIRKGRSICIFPEGGVPDESVFLDEFHKGAFALAIRQKVPLVSTTIYGLKEILPYAYFRGRPGTVKIYLNEIFETKFSKKEDIERIKVTSYQQIFNKLKELYNADYSEE